MSAEPSSRKSGLQRPFRFRELRSVQQAPESRVALTLCLPDPWHSCCLASPLVDSWRRFQHDELTLLSGFSGIHFFPAQLQRMDGWTDLCANGSVRKPSANPGSSPFIFQPVSRSIQPPVVGIVGGIGSGKSAVARGLADKVSTDVIDADAIGHQVLTFPQTIEQLRLAFGDAVFDDEHVDRKRLATLVFGDKPHQRDALQTLERIVHPQIDRVIQSRIEAATDSTELIILDAAVMLEAGWNRQCDFLVFIDTPFEHRLNRVREQRDWTTDELKRREASQLSLEEKQEAADFIVDNSGSLENSIQQLLKFVNDNLASRG